MICESWLRLDYHCRSRLVSQIKMREHKYMTLDSPDPNVN